MIRHADSFLVRYLIFAAVATVTFLVNLETFAAKSFAHHSHATAAHGHAGALERKMERLAPEAVLIFFYKALFPYSVGCAVVTSLLLTPHLSFIGLSDAEGISVDWNYWLLAVVSGLFLVLLWAFVSAKSYAYEVKRDGIYLEHGIFCKKTILARRGEIWTIRISADDVHFMFGLTAINLEFMPSDTGLLSISSSTRS